MEIVSLEQTPVLTHCDCGTPLGEPARPPFHAVISLPPWEERRKPTGPVLWGRPHTGHLGPSPVHPPCSSRTCVCTWPSSSSRPPTDAAGLRGTGEGEPMLLRCSYPYRGCFLSPPGGRTLRSTATPREQAIPTNQGPAAINQMGSASHFQAALLQVDGGV